MTPENLEMVAGDAKLIAVPVTDAEGAAVDVSTATAIRFVIDAATPVEKTLGAGCAVAGDSVSTVEVTLDPEDTADLVGVFATQLKVTLNGDLATILVGDLTILPTL